MKNIPPRVAALIVLIAVIIVGLVFYRQLRGPSAADIDKQIEATTERMFGPSAPPAQGLPQTPSAPGNAATTPENAGTRR